MSEWTTPGLEPRDEGAVWVRTFPEGYLECWLRGKLVALVTNRRRIDDGLANMLARIRFSDTERIEQRISQWATLHEINDYYQSHSIRAL